MKITREEPNVIRFVYRQQRTDPHYGSCLWAIFDIDLSYGMLNIASDCGSYCYRWPEKGNRFIEVLCDAGRYYLMGKLCKKSVVDEEATKREIESWMNDSELLPAVKEIATNELNNIFRDYDMRDDISFAQSKVEEWFCENNFEVDNAWEYVVTDYSMADKRIINIFVEKIKPELKEYQRRKINSFTQNLRQCMAGGGKDDNI